MNQATAKISVRGLWKVFGPQPRRILRSDWRDKGRAEVQKATGHVIALRDVSFDVAAGEVFVIMGLSGSGKSTLARCLLRLIESSEGQIIVDGQDITKYSRGKLINFRRRKAGMVFQRFALLPHRSVIDNVAWGLEIQGQNRRTRLERAREVLRAVDLEGWEANYPHELSGGMQQRVGLARALAADPEILLMDEPFSALDPLIRREVQDELIQLQDRMKKTIVFITHDLNEALKLGNRIAIMRDGAVIQLGTPEEIVSTPFDEYVSEFTKDINKAAVLRVGSIMKPPKTRVYNWQGPRVAIREMHQAEEDVAFVVDKEERLLGILVRDVAARAAETGDAASVTPLLETVPFVLSVDDSLGSALARFLDYDWSLEFIPVVDSERKLVGEVHRTMIQDLAAELSTAQARRSSAA